MFADIICSKKRTVFRASFLAKWRLLFIYAKILVLMFSDVSCVFRQEWATSCQYFLHFVSYTPSTLHRRDLKMENGKRIECFSVHTTSEEFFKKCNNHRNGHFGFVFAENSVWEITWFSDDYRDYTSFSEISVFKLNKKRRRFQIPPVWRALLKSSVFLTD